MLQQLLKPHRFEFIGPDAVGVRPGIVDRIRGDTCNSHTPLVQFRGDAEGSRTAPQHQHIHRLSQGQLS